MQTEEQRNITEAEEMEKIDLVSWLQDYLSCLKKFWLQFLLLFVIVAGIIVSYFEFTYEPVYSAKITYAARNRIYDSQFCGCEAAEQEYTGTDCE